MSTGAVILFICVLIFVVFEVAMLVRDIFKKRKEKKEKEESKESQTAELPVEDNVIQGGDVNEK